MTKLSDFVMDVFPSCQGISLTVHRFLLGHDIEVQMGDSGNEVCIQPLLEAHWALPKQHVCWENTDKPGGGGVKL